MRLFFPVCALEKKERDFLPVGGLRSLRDESGSFSFLVVRKL